MELSAACEAPRSAPFEAEDQPHPCYTEYLKYRVAMSEQLVTCPSFKNWLRQKEDGELTRLANEHPRIDEYRAWLRDCVHCTPPQAEYVDFWRWLELKQN